MADTAARLTDEVLPRVPVRQRVLSLPYEIRYRLAWDGDLVSAVLAVFLRVVYGFYQRQASVEGYMGGRCGSVTFVQRFGSALNVNPHFHVIVPDGVFVDGPGGDPEFVAALPLTDVDVKRIAETTAAFTPSSPRHPNRSTASPGNACLPGSSVSMPGLSSPAFRSGVPKGDGMPRMWR